MRLEDDMLAEAAMTPFALWLRTGRWVPAQIDDPALEVKFNPNHDPKDGRFTSGPGGASDGRGRRLIRHKPSNDVRDASNHETYTVKPGDTLTHLAATRVGLTVADLAKLNDLPADARLNVGQTLIVPAQDYLDRGKDAFDRFSALETYMQSHDGKLPPDPAHPPTLAEQTYGPGARQEKVNGYTFTIDPQGRTEEVTGTLTSNPDQERSRQAQANAGGEDRLPSDDGGHYIARRFDGPTDAFNHFAQDANFNRSGYRLLENGWATALARGEKVHVTISSTYIAGSKRPDKIYVSYLIGGTTKRQNVLKLLKQRLSLMTTIRIADLLERLGEAVAERAAQEHAPPHFFLYNEVAPGMMSCSLYRVDEHQLTYVLTDRTIDDLVWALWEEEEYGKRWRGIAMEVVDGRFKVSFDYPEGPYPPEDYSLEINEDEDEEVGVAELEARDARMTAAVTTRFGDRPIVYPSNEEVAGQSLLDSRSHSASFDLEPPSSG